METHTGLTSSTVKENMIKSKYVKRVHKLIEFAGGTDSGMFDRAARAFGLYRELTPTPTTKPTLSITNDCGDTCSAGEAQTTDAPEAASDDDDGGDSDGEPARRRPTKHHTPIPPALLGFEPLSLYVGLNRTRVYALIRQRKFPPPLKIGKSSRWQKSAVDAWIAAQVAQQNSLATE